MKKFLAMLLPLFLFACGGDGNEPDEPNVDPNPKPETPVVDDEGLLKIMSFNIRYNSSSDAGDNAWEKRKSACISMIKDINPDVIGFQEPRFVQRQYLKEKLTNYAFIEIPGTGDGKGGNVVMIYRKDRFTAVKTGYFFLSYTPDVASKCFDVSDNQWRGTVWAHLKDNETGKEFVAMDTHLPVGGSAADGTATLYVEARRLSSLLNVERLKELAGEDKMCFLFGDMNCSEKTSSGAVNQDGVNALKPMRDWMQDGRQSKDLTPAGITTFQSFGSGSMTPNRIIDCIFYRNAEAVDFQTIYKPYDGITYISDHYPVMLRVKL